MIDPILYILMRMDLDSLNPGKAMAQSNHAYGALKAEVKKNVPMQKHFLTWMDSTEQEFGTTLVLGGNEGEIGNALGYAKRWIKPSNYVAGWVLDPTYPVRDGKITHLVPLRTCAFIFGDKEWIRHAARHLDLHP